MTYGVMFIVNGTLGDIDEATKGFEDKNIKFIFPPQDVGLFTPIIVKCVTPDKETQEWMIERLQDADKVGGITPFFEEVKE